jgi:hypothetical protein
MSRAPGTVRYIQRRIRGRAYHQPNGAKVNFGTLQTPYSDEDAELQLISEDGVIFKVQAFYLKAAR